MTRDDGPSLLLVDRERLLALLDRTVLGELRVDGSIVRFGSDPLVDLHIDDNVVDIHDALRTRSIRGNPIVSDVRWVMARHSLSFPKLHGERLADLPAGSIVGDLGCGQIPYWNALPHDRIEAFYGFDGHLPSLRIAEREFASDPRLVLVHATAERTPVPDGVFDAVISSEVIEHVEEPAAYLAEARRILKPGGLLSLSTPCASMYLWPSEFFKVLVGWTSVRTFWNRLTPERRWRDALDWHPALRPSVLEDWVCRGGFEILRHDSTLWPSVTGLTPIRRFCSLAERFVGSKASEFYDQYLTEMSRRTQSTGGPMRWLGTRQFLLARKI